MKSHKGLFTLVLGGLAGTCFGLSSFPQPYWPLMVLAVVFGVAGAILAAWHDASQDV